MWGPPLLFRVRPGRGGAGARTGSGAGGRKEDAQAWAKLDTRCTPSISPPRAAGLGQESPGAHGQSSPMCGSACLVGSPEARVPTYMCTCIYVRATLRVGLLACVNTQSTWGAGAEYVLLAHTRPRVTASVRACTLKCTVLFWGPSLCW